MAMYLLRIEVESSSDVPTVTRAALDCARSLRENCFVKDAHVLSVGPRSAGDGTPSPRDTTQCLGTLHIGDFGMPMEAVTERRVFSVDATTVGGDIVPVGMVFTPV